MNTTHEERILDLESALLNLYMWTSFRNVDIPLGVERNVRKLLDMDLRKDDFNAVQITKAASVDAQE